VFDLTTLVLDILLWIPFAWSLLLLGGFVGWFAFGQTGAVGGAFAGFALGLVIDFSDSSVAKKLRVATVIAVVVCVGYLFFK
jgi:ABC-type branched-subunit amino acid transport system permease subunit